MNFTLVIPYYRNPAMLRRQALEWQDYPADVKVVVIDDGSPEPAVDAILGSMAPAYADRAEFYRIDVDIPWNRNGARNLGTHVATTKWVVHTDIDHVMPALTARELAERVFDSSRWYRFRRFRVGKADDTRMKDSLPRDCEYGEVKPHVDSFLCTRSAYQAVGGYDEDYSGSLGGSAPFLKRMERIFGEAIVLPYAPLHVYTRHTVPDASDLHLSRDRSRFKELRARKGDSAPASQLRFPWHRVR